MIKLQEIEAEAIARMEEVTLQASVDQERHEVDLQHRVMKQQAEYDRMATQERIPGKKIGADVGSAQMAERQGMDRQRQDKGNSQGDELAVMAALRSYQPSLRGAIAWGLPAWQ
ncbi:hypothetical protein [Chelativorans sp. Marseille-P2723]|uniref:hypothetical protein n=1 Tax=Chelativorans sp. Marseille-P2723 TaxID=2709133 RepID=UPI0015710A4C|nr:hypothetical protein [Chelativorans sp. Marseille-P2723]